MNTEEITLFQAYGGEENNVSPSWFYNLLCKVVFSIILQTTHLHTVFTVNVYYSILLKAFLRKNRIWELSVEPSENYHN